ncbi:hypothetical protein [Silvibacterium acidisoli]|uniref:hypothetical protein n=1 Tax=Acidobacteriaceae bacterium ZG23-2 TaxID=2883246 RepID=UPI00406D4156
MSEETQKLYVKHLQEFPIEVVKEAVKRIALEPRRDGETAFPPLAVVHARARAVKAEFKRRELVEEERRKDEEEFLKCVSEWMEDFGWSVAEIASRFPSRARLLRERWQA